MGHLTRWIGRVFAAPWKEGVSALCTPSPRAVRRLWVTQQARCGFLTGSCGAMVASAYVSPG
ncbi:hypothetical protein XFF7766_770060 [Xanthomonas citri pv. fuscans]|nr:hypothetical protein XFF7766_770060 [Xanthomonas citri pv. fuscans]